MDFSELRLRLEDEAGRARVALEFLDRFEGFVTALQDSGFGVDDVRFIGQTPDMQVNFSITHPVALPGLVAAPDLVEDEGPDDGSQPVSDAPPDPADPPAVQAPDHQGESVDDVIIRLRVDGAKLSQIARVTGVWEDALLDRIEGPLAAAIAAQSETPRHNLPWSDAEDDRLVEMIRGKRPYARAAAELGRSVDSVKYRCSVVLRDRISPPAHEAAEPAAAKAPAPRAEKPVAPKPDPKPAPAPVARPAEPAAVPVVPRGDVSPMQGFEPDDVTRALVDAHLDWLYAGRPDPDLVACDLELIEMLLRGEGAHGVAEAFEWSKPQVMDRFSQLRAGVPCTLALQQHLVEALRDLDARLAA